MSGFFKNLFRRNPQEEAQSFKLKYRHYRELLDRNNEVLETISALSDIRELNQWVSLGRLRSLVTRATVNVYRLIENLNYLSDNQYASLGEIFAGLEAEIIAKLETKPLTDDGPLSLPLAEADLGASGRLGGKAAALGDVVRTPGISTPRGIVLTTAAYGAFLDRNDLFKHINKELLTVDPEDDDGLAMISQSLNDLIMAAELPPELKALLNETYLSLQRDGSGSTPVILRSSAVGEDEAGSSFAGLYRSVINPAPEELEAAYKSVVASKFSVRALTYYLNKGVYHDLCPMAVLFMEMIPARAAGVMFTQSPGDSGEDVLISGLWGLGKLAVEGEVTPDLFRVERRERPQLIETKTGTKPYRLDLAPQGGVVSRALPPEMHDVPCLTEDQVERLAELGLRLEDRFGGPQDVEWVLDHDGDLHIVQCRPLVKKTVTWDWSDYYPWQDMAEAGEPVAKDLLIGNIGAACGPAQVVRKPDEAGDLAAGSIALIQTTSPDLVNILPKTAGLIAERGNTSGHLAIISREFDVPLAIGFPLAKAELLTSQSEITLDAFTGSVFTGRREPLLDLAASLKKRRSSVKPSPLRVLLDDVLQHITPLNLTNPRDPSFKPQSIKTIHDIIRFSHEKAINAMFEVNDSRFNGRGKTVSLKSNVPLDIYIIDLGGGLVEGPPKKRVTPEEIVSVPMRALYEGMTTPGVRWSGHVPIDFKGFVSVFANTMYDGAKYERRLGDRSYAILSPNYVNFSSRLGYHFSIVDAYVGDDENENYISFRFKGGAARLDKRTRRAQFLSEILNGHDFWVDQKADLINARIKRLTRTEMEEHLRMLGRLMGCSRQLDVTMYNQDMVDRYIDLFMRGEYSMGYGTETAGEQNK